MFSVSILRYFYIFSKFFFLLLGELNSETLSRVDIYCAYGLFQVLAYDCHTSEIPQVIRYVTRDKFPGVNGLNNLSIACLLFRSKLKAV